AREKAGILKPGAPVVLGPLPDEAMDAVADVAARVGAGPVLHVARTGARAGEIEVSYDGSVSTIRGPGPSDRIALPLPLTGAHQAENAGVAVGLASFLARRFPDRDLTAATRAGLASAEWPGRCERIEKDGVTVLLDAAHNP